MTRTTKFHNKPGGSLLPELAGRRFDSQLERRRAEFLCARQRNGEISDLQFQVTEYLSAARVRYRADFRYIEAGRPVWEDVKGMVTQRWRIIVALWTVYGPGLLRIVTADRRGNWKTKEVYPKGG